MTIRILTFLLLLSISSTAIANDEIQTVAAGRDYGKVIQTIKKFHNIQHKEDKYSKLVSVSLIKKTKTNSYIEKWTIQTKSLALFSYTVVLQPGGDFLQGVVYNLKDSDLAPSAP